MVPVLCRVQVTRIDWSKHEISRDEALKILEHAHECVDYVWKMLPNNDSPHWMWHALMGTTVTNLRDLRLWLKKGDL